MKSNLVASVVICTYNPRLDILKKVVDALSIQTISPNNWELIIVDNNSSPRLEINADFSWHPNSQIIFEPNMGLSNARIAGVKIVKTDLIIFVDDDNVLTMNYLETAIKHSLNFPQIGCFGGKSLPQYEERPQDWFFTSGINLGCQDFGECQYISNFDKTKYLISDYPLFAPIGTGMVIRKKAFMAYFEEIENSTIRLALGRKGKSLTSGEDNDIVLTTIKNGYEIGYFPDMVVTHLIPKNRFELQYLKRMAFESNRSWVKVLQIHQINPWRPISKIGLILRLIRLYLRTKPWIDEKYQLEWQSNFGKMKGLSEL
ncbi:glycosyltransferase involved in cell wall biosynthesis [Pedobacter sp. W3I1]|uniref:glycosyltransferase n=1 Tax=Pedobacter sp. W3I1 TaxID=3042291 RepID=UPI002783E576|nr:glycosyltransferase [Pedobacter sp. W3I1]MDQ0640907.1 glycosyltransferase involved in cell wall biosynthesis [Pedobacter sp. W3I1]